MNFTNSDSPGGSRESIERLATQARRVKFVHHLSQMISGDKDKVAVAIYVLAAHNKHVSQQLAQVVLSQRVLYGHNMTVVDFTIMGMGHYKVPQNVYVACLV